MKNNHKINQLFTSPENLKKKKLQIQIQIENQLRQKIIFEKS